MRTKASTLSQGSGSRGTALPWPDAQVLSAVRHIEVGKTFQPSILPHLAGVTKTWILSKQPPITRLVYRVQQSRPDFMQRTHFAVCFLQCAHTAPTSADLRAAPLA